MDEKNECRLQKGLALYKYSFQNHPMIYERKKYRCAYCKLLEYIVKKLTNEDQLYKKTFEKLKKRLSLKEARVYSVSIDELYQFIPGGIAWHGGRRFGRRDHRLLLIIESAILSWFTKDKIDLKLLESYARSLNMEDKEIDLLYRYIPAIFIEEGKLNKEILETNSASAKRCLSYIKDQQKCGYNGARAQRYRVAVCATMSSGKSTVLNAMLGKNTIPFGNMACTAKIISLEKDNRQESLLGGKLSNNQLRYSDNVDEVLGEWNTDTNVNCIYLIGRIKGIKSKKRILQLYDTPGVNYSQNTEHEELTKNFLLGRNFDLILYVCNAEQSGTTNEWDYLTWLKSNIVNGKKIDILFVVNKMDSLDSDNEDILKFLCDVYEKLCNIGFKQPRLLPIAADAARIFRLAMQQEKMTKKEKVLLQNNYRYFMDTGQDLRKYVAFTYPYGEKVSIKGTVIVEGKAFFKQDLSEAIERTGVPTLERILDKKIEEEEL